MRQAYLVVDIGTGNARAGVIATDGETLSIATRDTSYLRDTAFADGLYFHPKQWLDMVVELSLEALAGAGAYEIVAVSATSQREGIVLIDEAGEAFLGIPNVDNRAADCLGVLEHQEEIQRLTGFAPIPSFSGPKLFAVCRMQPAVAARIHRVTSISEWIGYAMTGEVVWEHSQAMHTLTYDHEKAQWSPALCGMFGINPDWLPPLARCGDVLGSIRPEMRERLGTGQQAVFVVGGSDSQLALIGMEVPLNGVAIIAGTTTPIERLLAAPPQHSGGWLNPHAIAGQYMLEVNAAYTGINYQRFKTMFFGDTPYEMLEAQALSRGLPRCMAMMSMGIILPEPPVMRGGFLFENPLSFDLEDVDFLHAIALDIACGLRQCIDYLDTLSPLDDTPIIGCGGGFAGRLMPRYTAALTNRTIQVPKGYRQASMLGCARACGQALGEAPFPLSIEREITPECGADLQAYYDRWYAYREAMRAMNGISLA